MNPVLTIGLVVQSHQLNPMQPEEQRVWVGGVDPGGCWISPEQLTCCVLDQLLGIASAQALRRILVHRRDVVALGRANDGAERSWGVEDRRRLLLLPAQALIAPYREEKEHFRSDQMGFWSLRIHYFRKIIEKMYHYRS